MTSSENMEKYESYKRYYPDKWAAISALRMETGMGFNEANQVINAVFGVSDDDERRADDEAQEKIYLAQEAQQEKTGFFASLKAFFSSKKE